MHPLTIQRSLTSRGLGRGKLRAMVRLVRETAKFQGVQQKPHAKMPEFPGLDQISQQIKNLAKITLKVK